LDFDGVLHSYTSGWQGARVISDLPVEGTQPFLIEALMHFDVQIYSARSAQWGGRRAMKRWLKQALYGYFQTIEGFKHWDFNTAGFGTHDEEALHQTKLILEQIKFPLTKPPASVTIDDRAWCFNGVFPNIEALKEFEPWNK